MNRLLHALGYSLQANRKTLEGKQHPDRDAQFNHINRRVRGFQRRRQPVVSVDTKKKELVGPFENAGREWRPRGRPEPVRVHDFPDKALGKAIPYGVYDLTHDAGWVSVGVDHDTASFAVETLRRWWRRMGCVSYPVARRLLITADGGGSNGSRNRLWKWELQRFADEMGLRVSVCHVPPGTSKWNKMCIHTKSGRTNTEILAGGQKLEVGLTKGGTGILAGSKNRNRIVAGSGTARAQRFAGE